MNNNEGGTTMVATTTAKGSGSGFIGSGKVLAIDERRPVSEATYVAAVRLIAVLGTGDYFTTHGKRDRLARSAWQWVVRLPDGTLATLTHLVTLDAEEGSNVRGLAAALAGFEGLLDEPNHCDAHRIIGRSAMAEVLRQPCGNGRTRPYVATAWALPEGVEPIVLTETCVWTPSSRHELPRWAPQWVQTYANAAARQHWEKRQQQGTQS